MNWHLVLIVFGLSFEEFNFIFDYGCCRLVTSFGDESRIVPVCYIFMCGYLLFLLLAIQKVYRCLQQPFVSLVVDLSKTQNHKGIVIYGCAELIELDESYSSVCAVLFYKFECVKWDPWIEGQSSFLE